MFSKITKETLTMHKSIHAIEWIPIVKGDEKKSFEKNRKVHHKDFFISEKASDGKMIKAKNRKIYYPVAYIEPYEGNKKVLGFDIGSNKTRLKTLIKAKNTNSILATDSIILVQNYKKAFLIFIPIYDLQLKNRIKGFVLGVFIIEDILKNALKEKYHKDIILDFVYSNKKGYFFKSNIERKENFEYSLSFSSIPDKKLIAKAFPSENYFEDTRSYLHYIVFIIGLLFILLSLKYILSIITYSSKMEEEVKKRTVQLEESNKKLKNLSIKDSLTKIYNRRYFDEIFDREFRMALRNETIISLMLIDIDYFKLYNDTYGHLEGDNCLKKVANCLDNCFLRPSDIVARYGGEEFVIILSNNSDLEYMCNKVIRAIRSLEIEHKSSKIENIVTVSLGCYSSKINCKDDKMLLIENADKALYEAKESGRNKYILKANI